MDAKLTRVDHPAKVDVDPGHLPWTRRLKYLETAELLYEYEVGNATHGVTNCPITAYIRDHVDDPILQVEDVIYKHEEWGPQALCGSIRDTVLFNNARSHPHGEAIAGHTQHYLALHLVKFHPFERARREIEKLFLDPVTRLVSGEAAYVLLAYINAGHPNPRKWLEKPRVWEKFERFGADLALFAAPDFD